MSGRLSGKVAVITGAASGIGKASVDLFVANGAKVVAVDIDDANGVLLQTAFEDSVQYIHGDVTSENDIAAAVATAVERFGKLDIFFNNAGAQGDPSSLLDLEVGGLEKTLALLTRSVVLGTKHAAKRFMAQGTPGAIVTTSSAAGIQGGWSAASYTIAKHAVTGVVRHAAVEFGAHGIRSNAIAPGIICTPIIARSLGIPPDQSDDFVAFIQARLGATQPMGRFGLAQDVAEAALWLGSDAAAFVNGVVLPVDGGATSQYGGSFVADIVAVAAEFKESRT